MALYTPDNFECCDGELPDGMEITIAHFTGALIAVCHLCSYKAAYWECLGQLAHNCTTDENGAAE